jgi:hypothetical protein
MDRRAAAIPEFGRRLQAAHARYAAERDAALPPGAEHGPSGGVAGTSGGVKCLHAHYADHAAGNDNPVGETVAPWVEPFACAEPCVVALDDRVVVNGRWREP